MGKPSVGRIVHYIWDALGREGGAHYPAIITEIPKQGNESADEGMALVVFNPRLRAQIFIEFAVHFEPGSRVHENAGQGTWHWPEQI